MLKKLMLLGAIALSLYACGDDGSDFAQRPQDDEEESSSSVDKSKSSSSSREDESSSSAKSSSSAQSSSSVKSSSSVAPAGGQCPELVAGSDSSAPRDTNWVPENVDAGSVYDSVAHTLKDLRDGQVYRTVTMGRQVWMAENLNYAYLRPTAKMDSTSICPCNIPDSCARYGRYYTMRATTDMYSVFGKRKTGYDYFDYDTRFPTGFVRGTCPKGWHVPTIGEFGRLADFVGQEAGRLLSKETLNATDDFGFTLHTSGRITKPRKPIIEDDYTVYSWLAYDYGYAWSIQDGNVGKALISKGMNSYDAEQFFTLRCLMDPVVADTIEPVDASTVVKDSMTDSRDGQVYPTVKIGTLNWMAKNLNYAYGADADSLSFCYENDADYCEKYGRLYMWAAAMDSAALFGDEGKGCGNGVVCEADGSKKVRGICPEGWHLPSIEEWRTFDFALGHDLAATKDTSWKDSYSNDKDGTDAYSFSALPAGQKSGTSFSGEKSYSLWWTAEEDGIYSANAWYIESHHLKLTTTVKSKRAYSVRCIED